MAPVKSLEWILVSPLSLHPIVNQQILMALHVKIYPESNLLWFTTLTPVQIPITSHLDYSSRLCSGLPPLDLPLDPMVSQSDLLKSYTYWLSGTMDSALDFQNHIPDHISFLLRTFQWLSTSLKVKVKIFAMIYKQVQLAPPKAVCELKCTDWKNDT